MYLLRCVLVDVKKHSRAQSLPVAVAALFVVTATYFRHFPGWIIAIVSTAKFSLFTENTISFSCRIVTSTPKDEGPNPSFPPMLLLWRLKSCPWALGATGFPDISRFSI